MLLTFVQFNFQLRRRLGIWQRIEQGRDAIGRRRQDFQQARGGIDAVVMGYKGKYCRYRVKQSLGFYLSYR